MYNGTVTFLAFIVRNGLKFPSCEFNPNEPGVEKVVIQSPIGYMILTTVHLTNVATEEAGRATATKVNTAALDRISFRYSTAIGNSQLTSSRFAPVNPPPGAVIQIHTGDLVIVGEDVNMIVSLSAADLKGELEQAALPGEQFFSFYRSALLSRSPVEQFMHLYSLLLIFFEDKQSKVDEFIRGQDPAVPESPDPRSGHSNMETVYTRLRNEFAHRRPGANIENTKAEMVQQVGGLITLVKHAIALQP